MKKILALLLVAGLALGLSGCFMDPAESLYAVPLQPESFYDLQTEIEKLIEGGAAYSPPTAGDHQQTLQMVNLDSDREEEAVVFLKTEGDAPLCLCVFDRQGEKYTPVDQVLGAGYAFDSVFYESIDDRPGQEIVIGRKIGEGVPLVLSVYSLREEGLTELMSTHYAEFVIADLDADGSREIVSFRADGDAQNGVAEYYRWAGDELVRAKESNLSAPVSAIKRIIKGRMCQNVPAVFVGSAFGENLLITDIFALKGGVFRNMITPDDTGFSVETLREYYVYSGDIDTDGLIELPRIKPLAPIQGDPNSENQSLITWFNLQENGQTVDKCVTYHNYSSGWYLLIPHWMQDMVAVTRYSLGSSQVYSFVDRTKGRELFALTAFNSDTAERSMDAHGMEKLTQKGDIVYACRIDETVDLSLQALREMFCFIRMDWNTGET